MLKYGAIPIVKGNVSQGRLPLIQCSNMLWNYPKNPWNLNRIVGTSTEASLLASRFGSFAITQDSLGEQHLNASFNGLNSFSCSSNRLPSSILI